MTETTSTPIGYRLTILTKPFVDSDTTRVREARYVGQDRFHIQITTNGRNRFFVPRETIVEMVVEVIR